VHKYDVGRLIPPDGSPERRAYNYWLHYAEGTFAPLMLVSLIMGRIETARPIAKRISRKVRDGFLDGNVKRNLDFMEATLSESTWFCGEEFTAADVQMSFAVEAAEARTNLRDEYPLLVAYLDRIRARPAYQAALAKGGHYELPSIHHR
jgi:glutathione S-transferase